MANEPATEDLSVGRLLLYTALFIGISLPIGMVFARSIAENNKVESDNGPEFIQLATTNQGRELTGKIIINIDPKVKTSHKLVDTDSREVLAYIYANNDILKVSEGFNATILGNAEKQVDGIDIVRVERLKLK